MKKFLYLLILILAALTQVSWAPFLSWRGYFLPVVLLVLFISTIFLKITEVLVFGFTAGIFLSLLEGSLVGLQSLSLILALGASNLSRNLFLGRKWFGFLLSAISAIIVYEIWFFFF